MRKYLHPDRISITIKAFVFWSCFCLLFVGLQYSQLPGIGGASVLVAAGVVMGAMLLLTSRLLRMDGTSFADIGLRVRRESLQQFATGLGLGVAVIAAMMGVLVAFTPLEIRSSTGSDIPAILGASLLVLLALALMEEIVFRSYPLFKLRQAWGIRPAVYITSVAFAFYHGLAFENLLGPGVWGVVYAWMALSTQSIALPTGFHLGLNWLQALLGMKPQYGGPVWELSIQAGSGLPGVEVTGLLMQLTLLVGGILLVETLVMKSQAVNPGQGESEKED